MGMMLDVNDLQVAMGPDAIIDIGRANYYIARITSHIQTETGITFGLVTGAVVRKYSDYDGILQLTAQWPVQAITRVHDMRANGDVDINVDPCGPYFDSIDSIFGLRSNKVYEITLDYGLNPVPADIKGVATEAVIRALLTTPTSLKVMKVGDVEEQFGGLLDFPPADQRVIDNYADSEGTYKLVDTRYQARTHRHNIVLNSSDFCDDGDCDESW